MRIIRMVTLRCVLLSNTACFIHFYAEAQNGEPVNQHTIAVGMGKTIMTDSAMSLSSEKILSTELTWSFTRNTVSRKKNIIAGWSGGHVKTSKGQLSVNEFSLQYIDAFSIVKNKDRRFSSYLGYSITVNPQFIKWGDQYSWATVNTLSLYNSTAYSWNKNTISLDLSIPFAGLASRPAGEVTYNGDINKMMYDSYSNLTFTSFHNLKAATISLHFRKEFSERFQFQSGVSFSYKDLRTGPDFLEQSYRVNAGLSYRLR